MDQKELENNYKQKTSMTSIRRRKQMRNKKGNKKRQNIKYMQKMIEKRQMKNK